MPLNQLTDRQRQTYEFIKSYIREYGYGPKLVEIAAGLGIRSRGTVHRYLTALVNQGLVEVLANKSRGIRLRRLSQDSGATNSVIHEISADGNYGQPDLAKTLSSVLPMAGTIAAGKPIEAIPDLDHIDLSEFFVSDNRFVLRVQGDSMIEAGILDGDMVVVEQCQTARDGFIVVALIDDQEATLKRIKNNQDGSISLIPENTKMKPMRYPAGRVSIQGRVVGQFRAY
ncbi:MAG: transcriptional repressor LexA [Acidiferrobacterales bacterium]